VHHFGFRAVPLLVTTAALFTAGLAHAEPASTGSAESISSADTSKRRTVLALGLGGGAIDDTRRGFASTSLALLPPLGRRTSLELIGLGALAPRDPSDQGDYWLRLSLGVRLELGESRLRPFVAPRLTHVHMAPVGTWKSHPVASMAGDSEHGLGHRSGLAMAIGATFVPDPTSRMRFSAAAEQVWLAIGSGPRWFSSLELSVGYAL
jgi:hypothetical protein